MKHVLRVAVLIALIPCLLAAQEPKPSKASDLFDEGMNDMIGADQYRDPIRGMERIRQAAVLGYAPAQMAMAFYSETPEQAFDWCKKAALQDDALGEWCVGLRYYNGFGVSRNVTEAEKWLRKAANQGNPFAAYIIGLIKEERDPKSAPAWFQQAAEQGLPQAQQKLGLLLKEGRYLKPDKYRAYVWLLVSSEYQGFATDALSSLESDLGRIAVNKAKTEARDLAQKLSRSTNAHGCTGWEGEFDPVPTLPPVNVQKFCR